MATKKKAVAPATAAYPTISLPSGMKLELVSLVHAGQKYTQFVARSGARGDVIPGINFYLLTSDLQALLDGLSSLGSALSLKAPKVAVGKLAARYRYEAKRSGNADHVTIAHVLGGLAALMKANDEASLCKWQREAVLRLIEHNDYWGVGAQRIRRQGAASLGGEAILKMIRESCSSREAIESAVLNVARAGGDPVDEFDVLAGTVLREMRGFYPTLIAAIKRDGEGGVEKELADWMRGRATGGRGVEGLDAEEVAVQALIRLGMGGEDARGVFRYVNRKGRKASPRGAKK